LLSFAARSKSDKRASKSSISMALPA
jgi:hypothetical protein